MKLEVNESVECVHEICEDVIENIRNFMNNYRDLVCITLGH